MKQKTDKTRVEIVDANQRLMVLETFDTLDEAQEFVNWWQNNPNLPDGGITIMNANRIDVWRQQNPLKGNRWGVAWKRAWARYKKEQQARRIK